MNQPTANHAVQADRFNTGSLVTTHLGLDNSQQNLMVPVGGSVNIDLENDEPAPIEVTCNIHKWMKAKVVVMDHPFAAFSNQDGVLEIQGLPVGDEIVFRAYHEIGKLGDVIVDGKETEWRSSKFEVEIKAGMNDMGFIEIPVDEFK